MSADRDRPFRLELSVSRSHPQLLEGLDAWLRLGLVSKARVRELCKRQLVCRLPEPVVAVTKEPTEDVLFSAEDFAPERTVRKPSQPKRERQTGVVASLLQSFKDELSVRWLLFLGVFLVILSSGVMTVTQWERFPAAMQYGILWLYTVVFAGVGSWLGREERLQLTSRTLQTIALLLVPVNFWAMDSFGLWGHPLEWVTVAIALVSLAVMALLLLRQRHVPWRYAFTFLGLSVLHWGWQIAGVPLFAVYLGAIATAVLLRFFPKRQRDRLPKTGTILAVFALAVLLVRAIFVHQLPVQDLGLAVGICGWLLGSYQLSVGETRRSVGIWESGRTDAEVEDTETQGEGRGAMLTPKGKNQKEPLAGIYQLLGAILLFCGWLICVGEEIPWQATAVSGLALSFFFQRLQRYGKRRDLTAIFLITLQGLVLVVLLIPQAVRERTVATLQQLTNYEHIAPFLFFFSLFAYLLAFIAYTGRFHNTPQRKLARWGEVLGLSLGLLLTPFSFFDPAVRSLDLALLTAAFALVTHRRLSRTVPLVYATHSLGLLAILSPIQWLFPGLPTQIWTAIFLGLMAVEWGLSMREKEVKIRKDAESSPLPNLQQIGARSSWFFGFILAAIAYYLLAIALATPIIPQWGLLSLLAPLTLTGVAAFSGRQRRQEAAWGSTATLVVAQLLTVGYPETRAIALGFAAGLMVVNSRYLQQYAVAFLHIGFFLACAIALVWENLTAPGWFLLGAAAIWGLWVERSLLMSRQGTLVALYARAADNWAIVLCTVELTFLTLQTVANYTESTADWKYLLAALLTAGAIAYRYWKNPQDTAVCGMGWAAELALAEIVLLNNGSVLTLAIANTVLALLLLFATEGLLLQRTSLSRLNSIAGIPLLYAVLGLGLRLPYFTATTGLITLGAALTGIGVGRRRPSWKAISYLAIAALSAAWYELVLYQMLQSPGGSPADGFTILAGVAVAIAIAYRLLAWFWEVRVGERLLNLKVTEIAITANIHWTIGSFLMVVVAGLGLFFAPKLTGLGVTLSLLLAAYATLQGRSPNSESNPAFLWVYVGIAEFAATWYYARSIWTNLNVLDDWIVVLFAAIAVLLYQLPWPRLGWAAAPWQNACIALPAIAVLLASANISTINLLGAAAFYAWVAYKQSNLRWSYLSLILLDWAIARWFDTYSLTDPLWFASLIGLSLLYIAQFDPILATPAKRLTRHHLRIAGSSIICVIALLYHQDTGLIPAAIALVMIFLGLGFRIRAFLYVGTVTFLLTAAYQLIVLIGRNSTYKWISGLIGGIVLIGIAANFERRREQIMSAMQTWVNQLEGWE